MNELTMKETNETKAAPPVDVPRLVRLEPAICIGRHANDGCGYTGGKSGGVCPKCGGMLLSRSHIAQADKAAEEWMMRDANPEKP